MQGLSFFFLVPANGGYTLIVMHRWLVVVASLAEDRGAWSTDSAVLGHGLSCRGARGILLGEG